MGGNFPACDGTNSESRQLINLKTPGRTAWWAIKLDLPSASCLFPADQDVDAYEAYAIIVSSVVLVLLLQLQA